MVFEKQYAMHTASNYEGTSAALRGCINDYNNYVKLLDDKLQIPVENRRAFIGKDYSRTKVVEAASELPGIVKHKDRLIYSNSSHGYDIPDLDGDEDNGRDQALYTDDGFPITDDEIHHLMTRFVPGATIIGFFDNCFAGTMDRSPFKVNWHYMSEDVVANAVFYFGCHDTGTSADAYIPGVGYNGAFTWCLFQVLKSCNYHITYLDLLNEINKRLRSQGYRQVAQMACTPGMEGKWFGEA